MKRLLVLPFLTFCFIYPLKAQTRLTIIASVHASTKYITQDTLLQALTRFKADVILMELDTSLMDEQGHFKKDPKTMSLESSTAERYRQLNGEVKLRCIDVAYRNKYYKDHNTFALEAKMGKAIDSLYNGNMMNDTSWFIINSLYSATQILNNFNNMRLKDINSDRFMQAASLRQNLLYRREVSIIKNNPDLKKWYSFAKEDADFWDLRNQTMVNNILKYLKQFPGKNVAVIVGDYHKYALTDGLKPLAKSNHFILVDNVAE